MHAGAGDWLGVFAECRVGQARRALRGADDGRIGARWRGAETAGKVKEKEWREGAQPSQEQAGQNEATAQESGAGQASILDEMVPSTGIEPVFSA